MRRGRGIGKNTPYLREIIARRYAEGAGIRTIAVEVFRTAPAVHSHLKAMGIPRRPAGWPHP